MPMEEALMAFAEIDISRMKNFTSEKEKGIPFIRSEERRVGKECRY